MVLIIVSSRLYDVTLVRVFLSLSHADDKAGQDEIRLTYAHRIHEKYIKFEDACRQEADIKMDLTEMKYEDVKHSHVTQDRCH